MNIKSKILLMESKQCTLTVSTTPSNATCTLTYNGNSYTSKTATVPAGTVVSYSVSYSGYTTQTGSWTITDTVTKYITLSPVQYSVTIKLQDSSGSAISGTIYLRQGSSGSYTSYSGSSKTITVNNGTVVYCYVNHSTYGTSSTYNWTINSTTTKTFKGAYSATTVDTAWTQPTLSANGTVGGNSFAVQSNSETQKAYRMFDSDSSSTSWVGTISQSPYAIFYNPTALKITKIAVRNSTSYQLRTGALYGSDTNGNWTLLKNISNSDTGGNSTWNISLSSNTSYYKYHKLTVATTGSNNNGVYIYIRNLAITAYTGTQSYSYYWNTPT